VALLCKYFAGATCRSALVRREDERAEALRATGAEIVVGDLTRAADAERQKFRQQKNLMVVSMTFGG
jgi:hypothetical protein